MWYVCNDNICGTVLVTLKTAFSEVLKAWGLRGSHVCDIIDIWYRFNVLIFCNSCFSFRAFGIFCYVFRLSLLSTFSRLSAHSCKSTRSSSKFHRSLFWSLPCSVAENKEDLHRKRVFFRSTTISYYFTNWCQKKLLQHMKLLYLKTVIF